MSFKDLALPLARRGIPVIPVEPLSKETRLPGGEERGTTDPAKIEAWDATNTGYNIGCLGTLDGVTIFDCDQPGLIERIQKETGKKIPRTFAVKALNGGGHLYFRQTDASRRVANKAGEGVFELRGNNLYVVGPGSTARNDSGALGEYRVVCDAPIADFPDWLEGWILANSSSKKTGATGDVDKDSYARLRKAYLENLRPEDMFGLPELTIESLHPTLHSLACLLHDGRRTEDDVADLLEKIATEYGHREARGRHEIDGIVEHAFKKQPTEFTLPDSHPSLTAFSDGLVVFATEEAYKEHVNNSWRSLFHTYEEFVNVPPIRFAIEGFLPEESITMLGGLPGHGKTLVGLAMVRALLEGSPLFGHFNVPRPSRQVIYLIPECGHAPFKYRLQLFRLDEHIKSGRLLYRTLSKGEILSLADPKVMEACRGADVFLDTAIRFISGDENAATDQKAFAQNLFDLLHSGARTVTGLHHSPKSTEKADYMSLENMLRGSGELGAALSACWGIRQIGKERNQLFIQNVKDRDFQACEPFIIEGRPHLDVDGYFKMTDSPGVAGSLNENKPRRQGERPSGRPEDPEKLQKMARVRELHESGKGSRDIAAEVGVSFKTVCRWLTEEGKNADSGE